MAAEEKGYATVQGFVSANPMRGSVLTFQERINDDHYVVIEIMPGRGSGAVNVRVHLAPEDAVKLAEKMIEIARRRGS